MIKFEGELLEKMSEFDHEIWKTAKTEEGYHNPSHCPFKNKGQWCRKCNPMFVPYNLLPDDIKELNRIRWRNIHTILNKLGLEIVQKEGEKHSPQTGHAGRMSNSITPFLMIVILQ